MPDFMRCKTTTAGAVAGRRSSETA